MAGSQVKLIDIADIIRSLSIGTEDKKEQRVLRNGDIVISTSGGIRWTVYNGDADPTVADDNVVIIRAKQGCEEWLRLFFNTNTGRRCLDSLTASVKDETHAEDRLLERLKNVVVPDQTTLEAANRVGSERDLEQRVAALFENLGWEVRSEYTLIHEKNRRYKCDIALFHNGELKGVVEVKLYRKEQVVDNQRMLSQLEMIRRNVGQAAIYLFVDDQLYEFKDYRLEQVLELPVPGADVVTKEPSHSVEEGSILALVIGSLEEMPVSDRILLEAALSDPAKRKQLMQSLKQITGNPEATGADTKITPYKGSKPYIFISYAHLDMDEAMAIVSELIDRGYRIWYDEGIDPGTEWDENIAAHIENSSMFIALMSNHYIASTNCKDELNYARDLELDRILVYLENVTLPGGMRMRLSRLQAIHKYTYLDLQQFYEKVEEAPAIEKCKSIPQN